MPELRNYRHETFCMIYAETIDVTESEKAARLSRSYGYKLLDVPEVRARICEIQRGTADRMVITQNRALREACYLAFSDITQVLDCKSSEDFQSLPEHTRKAIASIDITEKKVLLGNNGDGEPVIETERTYKLKMHSKVEPLKLVAQVTGLLDTTEEDKEQLAFTGINIIADITKPKQIEHKEDEK